MSTDRAGAPGLAPEVSIKDVQQQVLAAVRDAVERGEADRAHCLAGTYETLVHAETMSHEAMRAAAERALRQLDEARTRAAPSPNMAMGKAKLETA